MVAAALLATFIVLPTWSNFDRTFKVRRPAVVLQTARWLRLNQIWKMFAPAPLKTDFWWVVEARRKDGERVDLMRGGAPLTFGKPPYASQMYLTGKHRRLWMSLKCKSKPLRCKRLLDRMCRDHNAGKAKDDATRVVKTTLWKMNERTPKKLHVKPKVKKRREFHRTCPGSRGSPRARGAKKRGKRGKKAKLRRGKKKLKSAGKPRGKSGGLSPPPRPKRGEGTLGLGGAARPWLRPASLKAPRVSPPKPRPPGGSAPADPPPAASP